MIQKMSLSLLRAFKNYHLSQSILTNSLSFARAWNINIKLSLVKPENKACKFFKMQARVVTGFELILSWPNVWARAFGSGRVPDPASRRSRSSRIQKENKKFKKCVRSIFHFNIVTPTFYETFFLVRAKDISFQKKKNCKTEQNVRLCLSNFFCLLPFFLFTFYIQQKKVYLMALRKNT